MFCMNCGKQIEDGAVFCPLCGAQQQATSTIIGQENFNEECNTVTNEFNCISSTSKSSRLNPMCVIGFVVSLLSIPFFFIIFMPIIGLVISIYGYLTYRTDEKGKGFGMAGIVISGIIIIIYVFFYIYFIKELVELVAILDSVYY